MVRAGIEVLSDAARYGLLVTPSHDRVDEPIAATTYQVILGKTQPKPIVHVVGQPDVLRKMFPRDSAGGHRICI
jgi:hypothetical protein